MRRSLLNGVFAGLVLLAPLAAPGLAAAADAPISESARMHFKVGVNLLQDPSGARYEEAYREFKAAYADSPSPRILGNMGLCAMKLERDGEAIQALEGYLSGVKEIAPDERRQVTMDLNTLKAGAAKVSLKFNVPGAQVFDVRVPTQGSNVNNVYGPAQLGIELSVRTGHHAITIKLEGYAPQTFEFDASPGAKISRTITLEKPSANAPPDQPGIVKERPIPLYVWIAGGASIAALGAGAVTGAIAVGKKSDYNTTNTGAAQQKAEEIRSSGQTLNVVTDVLLLTGLVGAGVTTYLYVARPTIETPGSPRKTGFVRLDFVPISDGPGARLVGAF